MNKPSLCHFDSGWVPKSKRERILTVLLASIFLGVMGWESMCQLLLGSFHSRSLAIASLDRKLSDLEAEAIRVQRASRELADSRVRSLPSVPSVATAWYQKWLLELLDESGWTNVVVTPNRAWPEPELGHRLPFAVRGDAAPLDVAAFLDAFHSTPLLHKLTALSIQGTEAPTGDGRRSSNNIESEEAPLKVVMAIEALSLADADPVAGEGLGQRASSPNASGAEGHLAQTWSRHDWFSRPKSAPSLPTQHRSMAAEMPKAPETDQEVRLVASIANGRLREAWLYDGRTRETVVLNERSPFQIADVRGTVLRIEADSVTLALSGGTSAKVQLGHAVPMKAR